jgi:diguanylate cyclase (GGDEF)-like protein
VTGGSGAGAVPHGGWPPCRLRRLALEGATCALLLALLPVALDRSHPRPVDWVALCLLGVLACASDLVGARVRADPARSTAPVFLVAAAIVLPPGLAPFVALAVALPALRSGAVLSERQRLLTPFLATLAASAVAHLGGAKSGPAGAGIVLVSAGVFLAVTACVAAVQARLDRRRLDLAEVLGGVGRDGVLALLGVTLAVLWRSDPWLAPLALLPLVLVERAQSVALLVRQAQTDAKTGLMNMHAFGAALEAELARSRALRRPLSLVVLDLDLLREINNRHGHLVGDAVIRGISDVLRQELRRGDLAARFGGEEFMVALPNTSPDRAFRIAERIREAVAETVFSGGPSETTTRATISAGVAAFPRDAAAASALVHAADLAVIAAKTRGRNRTVDASRLRRTSVEALPVLRAAAQAAFEKTERAVSPNRRAREEDDATAYRSTVEWLSREHQLGPRGGSAARRHGGATARLTGQEA